MIEEVDPGSPAGEGGIVQGDRLVSLNDQPVRDMIDLLYHAREGINEFGLQREDRRVTCGINLERGGMSRSGLSLRHPKVKTCRNKCIFCFVSQLPRRLRPSLYVRDEDYRMSFLYGNYVTLTNLSAADKARIVAQRLSPLYISVHSTEPAVRSVMLGNSDAGEILKEIRFFADSRIRMHTQIVLCPGYNDGIHLAKTISDLYRFYPHVSSVAVVPVGLTMHRKKQLRPVEREDALGALQTIQRFQTRFRRKHGEFIVYASDEMYIKAGLPFPPLSSYEDLPQIENGVGMVPLFMHQARRLKMPQFSAATRFVTFTGTSFFPYLAKVVDRMRKAGADIEAVAVANRLFGESVTVAGLLSGRDVMGELSGMTQPRDVLLIPDVVMKEGDEIFLDDVSRKDVEDVLGLRAVIIESTPQGLAAAVQDLSGQS